MREIKFRGRDEQGGWHFGMLRVWRDQSFAIETTQGLAVDFVDPDTVGQFTGLTDADGREIYEGDIVRIHGMTGNVFYDYDGFVIDTPARYKSLFHCTVGGGHNCHVIGNVHDNPELLRGDGNA